MSDQTHPTTIAFKDLPKVGEALASGTFAGILTLQDSTHVAVVLLPNRGDELTWQAAMDWASEQGGTLPSRPAAALLFANLKDKLHPDWHWTNETHVNNASYAWYCDFGLGGQDLYHKSYDGCAVAVRLIHLTA
jgi:hypothetical protein